MSTLAIHALFFSFLLIGTGFTARYNGYDTAIPADPYVGIYESYYSNLNAVLPCVMQGNVFQTNAAGSPAPVSGYIGCQQPAAPVEYFLFPIDVATSIAMETECMQNPLSWAAPTGLTALSSVLPQSQGAPIMLVLSPFTPPTDPAIPFNQSCCPYTLRCVMRHVVSSQLLRTADIRGIAYLNKMTDAGYLGSPSPNFNYSPYPSPSIWCSSNTNAMWMPHNFSMIMFPDTVEGCSNFNMLVSDAYFNRQQLNVFGRSNALYPRYVAQATIDMFMLRSPVSSASPLIPGMVLSCLTQSIPSCLPIGGISVWGTTAPSIPSLPNPIPWNFVRPSSTPDDGRNIAVVVSASSFGTVSDAVPSATTAASIVAALLVMDALSSAYLTGFFRSPSKQAPQVFFFFFVGEDFGLAGSGRFLKEIQTFNCTAPLNGSADNTCNFPFYRTTNFTGINPDSFQHFIHLDQLVGGPLMQHVDASLASSPAQVAISQLLSQQGLGIASSSQIPPGPLSTFLRSSKYRSTQSFTTIGGYNAEYVNKWFQSSADTAGNVANQGNIVVAAQATVNVVAQLLGLPLMDAPTVNASLSAQLWPCFAVDQGCPYFRNEFGFNVPSPTVPNYYPSVFQYYQSVLTSQQFVRYFMLRAFQNASEPFTACPCNSPLRVCLGGRCVTRYAFEHHSFSPALDYSNTPPVYFQQDTTWMTVLPGRSEEIWVESFWGGDIGVRTAVTDSASHGGLLLLSGLLTTALVFLLYFGFTKIVVPKLKSA